MANSRQDGPEAGEEENTRRPFGCPSAPTQGTSEVDQAVLWTIPHTP